MNRYLHRSARAVARAATLIELIVVLLVVVILSAGSITLWARYHRDAQMDGEARKIDKLLATTRAMAMGESAYYRATFWPADMSYWIDETDAGGNVLRPKVLSPERMSRQVEIDQLIGGVLTTSGNTVSLRFYPDGTSDNATIYIIEKDADHSDDTQYYTIKLYGPTGRTAIFANDKI